MPTASPPALIVSFRSLTPVAADALVTILHDRRAPGAVWLSPGPPPRRAWWLAVVAVNALAIAATIAAVQRMPLALPALVGLAVGMIASLRRAAWRATSLPWRPGIYAIGPHVVDARTEAIAVHALVRVAGLDSDPGAVVVLSTRGLEIARTGSPAAAQAMRARIARAEPSEPGRRDVLREVLSQRRARVAPMPGPLALRHAWATGAIAAVAMAMILTITR
jgi:hypothetical protein